MTAAIRNKDNSVPLLQQSLSAVASNFSFPFGSFYFTDHSLFGQHKPKHIDEFNIDDFDNVKVEHVYWLYEHRIYYTHTFIILKTKLSPQEKKALPGKKFKFYVTEKNDLGIIWSVFYDFEEAKSLKTEHDGFRWKRENVHISEEKRYSSNLQKMNIKTIKSHTNNEVQTKYNLILSNCHIYG